MSLSQTLLFSLALVSSALADPSATSAPLRVMSFNVRLSTPSDGENQWSLRRDLFLEVVRAFHPDLLGLQEVKADQYDYLCQHLSDYTPIGVARDDGARKGEWSLILFRTARFQPKGGGTFWLSEEPETVGKRGWDAALPRICTWAKLQDTATGRPLLFANTHFDHKGLQARPAAATLLRQRLPELAAGADLILAGDFNSHEDSEAYRTLTAAGASGAAWQDSFREIHPHRDPEEATFHGFKGGTAGSRIDWILHTPALKATEAEIVRTHEGARYPSDHFAVTAVIEAR